MRALEIYRPLPVGPEADEDELVTAALVPELDTDVDGVDRLLALGLGVLRGLVDAAAIARAELPRTGIVAALPAPDAVVATWQLARTFLPQVLGRSGLRGLADAALAIEDGGHTAVPSALRCASAMIQAGTVDQCIVLGVDSYIDFARLQLLDQAFRLKSQRGLDGFIPGEAAVALLVERDDPRRPPARRVLGRLAPPELADEAHALTGEKASTGTGLVAALRGAIRHLPRPVPLAWMLCDLNGESYRAFEWGLVQARLARELGSPLIVQHPADCIGETGAAAGGLLVACALRAFARRCAAGDVAAIWNASDGGSRSAMLAFPPHP
jgi:3-oxoacyl-[acyl-carrier-protein] synthase-1